jgi:hypothetical protein
VRLQQKKQLKFHPVSCITVQYIWTYKFNYKEIGSWSALSHFSAFMWALKLHRCCCRAGDSDFHYFAGWSRIIKYWLLALCFAHEMCRSRTRIGVPSRSWSGLRNTLFTIATSPFSRAKNSWIRMVPWLAERDITALPSLYHTYCTLYRYRKSAHATKIISLDMF